MRNLSTAPRIVRTWAKPAGLPVFPPHDDPGGDCLVAQILAAEPERAAIPWPTGFEAGVVHRLDNATSGAVAVAEDLDDLHALRTLFRAHRLSKTYWLWVARDPPWDANRCAASIAHDPRHRGRMVVQRGVATPHRGRWLTAHTEFRRLRGRLFEATMTTGVMHQIRVHAAFLGIPLQGDRRYGGGDGEFRLHHVGFCGPHGLSSAPVPDPPWLG